VGRLPSCFTLVAAIVVVVAGSLTLGDEPKGWHLAGRSPEDYVVDLERDVARPGMSAVLKSHVPEPADFGTLMQSFGAGPYRGERIRMTGQVKAIVVEGWAGLWMRVDAAQDHTLHLDNMADRPIKGSHDWTEYSIVLDVPTHSRKIAFGILLSGRGEVWLDDVSFERVGNEVPTTGLKYDRPPSNLDFEE